MITAQEAKQISLENLRFQSFKRQMELREKYLEIIEIIDNLITKAAEKGLFTANNKNISELFPGKGKFEMWADIQEYYIKCNFNFDFDHYEKIFWVSWKEEHETK